MASSLVKSSIIRFPLYFSFVQLLVGCALPKAQLPVVPLSPVLAAQEADDQCVTYGLNKGSSAYIACVRNATNRLLYNNAVAICGQKSFSNQCDGGVMSTIDPSPAQSFETTQCKQRMYNICVQSAAQEYLTGASSNSFG